MARHLRAILALPFMVLVVIPAVLVTVTGALRPGWGLASPLDLAVLLLGLALAASGLALLIASIRLFMRFGAGTLSPLDETQRLVVIGPYRYVRNPMISGVLYVLLGEAAFASSLPLLLWFGAVFAANAVYLPLVEEPGLSRRFGDDYATYKANVPRWLPRIRPWGGGNAPP